MSKAIVVKTKFNAPVATVFDLLSKHATYNEAFAPIQVERIVDSNDASRPDGVGSIRRMGFGAIKPIQEQITLLEENKRIEYQIIKNPLVKYHLGCIEFEALNDKQTSVTYTIHFQAKVPVVSHLVLAQLKLAISIGFAKLNKRHFA